MLRAIIDIALFASFIVAGADAEPTQPKIPIPQIPKTDVDPKMPYFVVCAQMCGDCARHCEIASAHCAKLIADGKKELLDTLKQTQDCAAICQLAAAVAARDGPMADVMALACAEACKRCGDACDKHTGDPILKRCAEDCRKCEKVCREMHKQKKASAPDK